MEPNIRVRPGTWMDSDNGFVKDSWFPWNTNGHLQIPSNVTRICRALESRSAEGIPQIVYYQAGLGSGTNWYDHFVGGGTGSGISENIREAYAFIADNYESGDDIFVIGFSRGAFTARSIVGLVAAIGLLTRRGLEDFYSIFQDWEYQIDPNYVSKWPDKPFPNRPNVTNPRYPQELERLGLSRINIPIRAVGVWDTVGSLGIPTLWFMPQSTSEYAFVDTKVSPNVEYAFQALALDEHRRPYTPTVWEQPDGQRLPRILKQCWFPGVHANIGGGYDDTEVSDITLAWMMSQLDRLLTFNSDYIFRQRELNIDYYHSQTPPEMVRTWGLGEIYNSMRGIIMILGGKKVRTPGQYYESDPQSGDPTNRPLENTNEHIHTSVRLRIEKDGFGTGDKGNYHPTALKGFKLVKSTSAQEFKPGISSSQDVPTIGVRWVSDSNGNGRETVLPEDVLGDIEIQLKTLS